MAKRENQKIWRYLNFFGVHSRSNLTKNEVRMAWKWSKEWNSLQKVIKPLSFYDQSIFNILGVTVDRLDLDFNEGGIILYTNNIWMSFSIKIIRNIPLDRQDSVMLHMQKFQQQQIHCKVALLSINTQSYSMEKLHIPHEVQLNLKQLFILELQKFMAQNSNGDKNK